MVGGSGVAVVWVVLPASREVVVLTASGESRHGKGEQLPAHPDLPGLALRVNQLFAQLDRAT